MEYVGVRVSSKDEIVIDDIVGVITNETPMLFRQDEYIIQFKIINYSNKKIFDHIVSIRDGDSKIISEPISLSDFNIVNEFLDEGINKQEFLCYVKFKPEVTDKYKFGICRTLDGNDKPNSKLFDIREISCEKGTILPDFKDNTTDLQSFIKRSETYFEQNDNRLLLLAKQEDINQAYSKIEVETSNILLEVNKKVNGTDIISSINMSPENIKIKSESIDMTGNLDLNGTFKCYKNGSNKSGHYLYQHGAIHRGYLEYSEYPTFSSGIWRPDGKNDMGYVSVGWTNSDNIDTNGCLWMSPIAGGGGQIIYSRLLDTGVGSVSGILYQKNGMVEYYSAIDNKTEVGIISHRFDGGLSAYTGFFNDIYSDGSIRVNATVYTNEQSLFLTSGGYNNPYFLQLMSGGYLLGNNIQLGQTTHPFYQLVSTHAPAIVSDARKKHNIYYINSPYIAIPYSKYEVITTDDMYDYVKNDLKLATYELNDNRDTDIGKVDIGFIAQDVCDTKVGKYVVNSNDPENLTYDMSNRISVLEGALQTAIRKIEELESKIM